MAGLVHGRQGIRRFLKVIVSRSNCIFENLAFEEWLFRNHNVAADGELVLLWRYFFFFDCIAVTGNSERTF